MTDDGSGVSRREFLRKSGAAAVGVGLGALPFGKAFAQNQEKPASPSEKIVVGFIGLGGRGMGHVNKFKSYGDVEVGAVCDVYEAHLQRGVQAAGDNARAYSDFRKLLEQKDIDAVVVATPPHWHPLISILACQAGKDVYCEKPMCRFPTEGRAMAAAARDNKRVTQIGTQVHAGDNFRRAVEIVQSGALGKIATVKVVCNLNEYPKGLGKPADTPPPTGLDWDMWLGPAPVAPFNETRFEAGNHRYFMDYVGGWLLELGPHIADLAWWGMNAGEPKSVSASGGRFVADDISDIPDVMDVLWQFDDYTITWTHSACNSFNFGAGDPPTGGRQLGVFFQGNNGTLFADYGRHKLFAEGDRMKDFQTPPQSIPPSPGHDREFLDCVKSRQQPSCSFDNHLPLGTALALGRIAYESGRKLDWDAKAGRIVGDRATQRLAYPDYRKPWRLPA
jgi:predicted dehydrogenase